MNKEPIIRTDEDGDKEGIEKNARGKRSWTEMIQGVARRAAIHEKGEVFKMRERDNLPKIVNAIRGAIKAERPGLLQHRGHEKHVLPVMNNIARRDSFKRHTVQQGFFPGSRVGSGVDSEVA